MKPESLQERIEKYLAGALTSDEVSHFEKEVLEDPALAAELKSQFLATATLERKGDESLKSLMKDWANEQFDERKSFSNRLNNPLIWLAIAATITLLITLAVVLNTTGPANPEEIYNQYYTELRFPADRSSTADTDSLWNLARISYGKQDYENTLSLLDQLIRNDPDGQAFLYKGICLLRLDRPGEAAKAFGQVTEQHLDYQRARWFRALALLKIENLSEAKVALEAIAVSESHFKKKEAQEILDLLEM